MQKIINYRCGNCNVKDIAEIGAKEKWNHCCPYCGAKVKTFRMVFSNSKKTPVVNIAYRDNPRYSEAMGVNIDVIPEAMRMFPDSEYHPETGALLIKNRAHKLKEMKRRGYDEFDKNSGSWRRQKNSHIRVKKGRR